VISDQLYAVKGAESQFLHPLKWLKTSVSQLCFLWKLIPAEVLVSGGKSASLGLVFDKVKMRNLGNHSEFIQCRIEAIRSRAKPRLYT